MREREGVFIVDADVLIDFADADPTILTLFSRHHGQVHVLEPVLEEVDDLDATDCEGLGIRVVPVETEILLRAGQQPHGGLSFSDRLCLLVAKEQGACCITNDTALRRACKREGLACMWGLEIMIELVAGRNLRANDAVRVAETIHEINPRYITRELLQRFGERLREIGDKE